MRFWANLIGYQAAWFIAVGFAARGYVIDEAALGECIHGVTFRTMRASA